MAATIDPKGHLDAMSEEPTVPTMEGTLRIYLDGVDAVARTTAKFGDRDWSRPTPCAKWRTCEIAAHLHATAARYHDELDCAVSGQPAPLIIGEELARFNAHKLDTIAPSGAPEHIRFFRGLALSYAKRLPDLWNLRPYLSGWDVSVGEAAGAMAIEWHVHAWDLAQSVALQYRPDAADTLESAWRISLEPVFSVAPPAGDPWDALLVLYGRELDWSADL